MNELILLRHAEAVAADPQGDLARPLTDHGLQQARRAGHWLQHQGCIPDRIVHSPARRTQNTAELVQAAMPQALVQVDDSIWEASAGQLLALATRHEDCNRLMLVGHNPGIQQLLAALISGPAAPTRGMSPASLAVLAVRIPLEPGSGHLRAFWTP